MPHDIRREQDTTCNQSNRSQHDKNRQHSARAGGEGFAGRIEVPCWLSRAFRLRQARRLLAFQQGCPAFITKDSILNAGLIAMETMMHMFRILSHLLSTSYAMRIAGALDELCLCDVANAVTLRVEPPKGYANSGPGPLVTWDKQGNHFRDRHPSRERADKKSSV